jgi:mono/diheme cytochrome c family protein
MLGKLTIRLCFVGGLGWLVACGGASSEGDTTAAGADQYSGPIVASADAAAGETVFEEMCAGCHPGGGSGIGPSLLAHPLEPGFVRLRVREGVGRMPPFPPSRISDDDLENVLAYLDQLGAMGGSEAGAAGETAPAEADPAPMGDEPMGDDAATGDGA